MDLDGFLQYVEYQCTELLGGRANAVGFVDTMRNLWADERASVELPLAFLFLDDLRARLERYQPDLSTRARSARQFGELKLRDYVKEGVTQLQIAKRRWRQGVLSSEPPPDAE